MFRNNQKIEKERKGKEGKEMEKTRDWESERERKLERGGEGESEMITRMRNGKREKRKRGMKKRKEDGKGN